LLLNTLLSLTSKK